MTRTVRLNNADHHDLRVVTRRAADLVVGTTANVHRLIEPELARTA